MVPSGIISSHACHVHLSCMSHDCRFPVPVSGKAQQPPWFTSALRNEVLFLEMKEWSVASQLHPQALAGEAPWKLDYQFALAQGTHTFLHVM